MLGRGCSAVGARPWVRLQGVMDGSTGWLECLSSESVTEMRVLKKFRKDPKFGLEYAEVSKRKLQVGRLVFPEYDPEQTQHIVCINSILYIE